jgi:hypothetical protein
MVLSARDYQVWSREIRDPHREESAGSWRLEAGSCAFDNIVKNFTLLGRARQGELPRDVVAAERPSPLL